VALVAPARRPFQAARGAMAEWAPVERAAVWVRGARAVRAAARVAVRAVWDAAFAISIVATARARTSIMTSTIVALAATNVALGRLIATMAFVRRRLAMVLFVVQREPVAAAIAVCRASFVAMFQAPLVRFSGATCPMQMGRVRRDVRRVNAVHRIRPLPHPTVKSQWLPSSKATSSIACIEGP
jgi:hypothetical protein